MEQFMVFSSRSAAVVLTGLVFIAGCDHQDGVPRPPVSQIVVFGDSLSDGGTYNPTTADNDPANDSRTGFVFTTKPGLPWASKLAGDLGIDLGPNQQVNFGIVGQGGAVHDLGGLNYAEGGATIRGDAPNGGVSMQEIPGLGLVPVQAATRRSVATQITDYLDEHNQRFDAGQLVLIQGGANDFFAFLQRVAADPSQADEAAEVVAEKAAAMVSEVGRIRAAAATNVIYCNLPDLGLTPRFQGTPLQALATELAVNYNASVAATLNAWNVPIFDMLALTRDLSSRPGKFGFSDVSTPACNSRATPGDPLSVSALLCTPITLVAPKADMTHVFADFVHPTSRGHAIWADQVLQLFRSL
jgi:outer membrane lipase/esterase